MRSEPRVLAWQMPSRIELVARFWDHLEPVVRRALPGEVRQDQWFELKLALSEAMVNAVRHAHHEDGRPLRVELSTRLNRVELRILDSGPGFDLAHALPRAAPEDESGRGLWLMRSLTDELSYQRSPEHNVLLLRKRMALLPAHILIVDDDPDNCLFFARLVGQLGHVPHRAHSGAEALRFLADHPGLVDTILLDVMMPDMDGFEVTRRIRCAPDAEHVPILLITARETEEDVETGLDLGADDYLRKPVRSRELLARIRSALRLRRMDVALRGALSSVGQQLEQAAQLQRAALPRPETQLGPLRCASHHRPCEVLAGDTLDCFLRPDGQAAFYVVDVAGHGAASAMMAFWLHRLLRGGGSESSAANTNPARMARALDRLLEDSQRHLTAFLGVVDLGAGVLRYCRAGHPPAVLLRADGRCVRLEEGGPPPGFGLELPYSEGEVALGPGDRVFVYTDGLSETVSPRGEPFGEARLEATLSARRGLTLPEQVSALLTTVITHHGSSVFTDDLTVLALELGEDRTRSAR